MLARAAYASRAAARVCALAAWTTESQQPPGARRGGAGSAGQKGGSRLAWRSYERMAFKWLSIIGAGSARAIGTTSPAIERGVPLPCWPQ